MPGAKSKHHRKYLKHSLCPHPAGRKNGPSKKPRRPELYHRFCSYPAAAFHAILAPRQIDRDKRTRAPREAG